MFKNNLTPPPKKKSLKFSNQMANATLITCTMSHDSR